MKKSNLQNLVDAVKECVNLDELQNLATMFQGKHGDGAKTQYEVMLKKRSSKLKATKKLAFNSSRTGLVNDITKNAFFKNSKNEWTFGNTEKTPVPAESTSEGEIFNVAKTVEMCRTLNDALVGEDAVEAIGTPEKMACMKHVLTAVMNELTTEATKQGTTQTGPTEKQSAQLKSMIAEFGPEDAGVKAYKAAITKGSSSKKPSEDVILSKFYAGVVVFISQTYSALIEEGEGEEEEENEEKVELEA